MDVNLKKHLLGIQQSIQFPISTAVTTNTQSLLSSYQQHHAMTSSELITQYLAMLQMCLYIID